MKLAFYYHIPIYSNNNKLYIPSYIGVFIDSLAKNVSQLYLVLHEMKNNEKNEADYELKGENIKWVNLGIKTAAWHRELFNKKILKNKLKEIEICDTLIVRSPSPLAPYFRKYLKKPKIWFMIVGDYLDAAEHYKTSTIRNKIIYQYLKYNDYKFNKEARKVNLFVNSIELYEKYKKASKNIHLIKTTTLSDSDFFERNDTCKNENIELLYTGRIDIGKGLIELVDALNVLINNEIQVRLHIVGWEQDDIKREVENKMKNLAKSYGIENHLIFHGRKKVGSELNEMYRLGDIYVIPSYHEGFPRTIWEAMANSLPVIATEVGGIPSYLSHLKNAYLIKPKSVSEIVDSIKIVIQDKELRKTMIKNGFNLAKENTLEKQSENLISIIEKNSI